MRFRNLLECSARNCYQNFAILRRLGVGSISAGWVRPAIGIKIIAADVWRGIILDLLKALSESMPRRMAAVIDAQRQDTKF